MCPLPGTDHAHGFRRGNRISYVLSDQPCFVFRACRFHHNVYDGRAKPRDDREAHQFEVETAVMEWHLVELAEQRFGTVPRETGDQPVDVARRIERMLETDGRLAGMRERDSA